MYNIQSFFFFFLSRRDAELGLYTHIGGMTYRRVRHVYVCRFVVSVGEPER